MYSTDHNTVYYNGVAIFEAPDEIKYSVTYRDKLILNYNIPIEKELQFSEDENNRNIVCIDPKGTTTWRIQEAPESSTPVRHRPRFQNIRVDENGVFWAFDGGGWQNKIDPETGKILDREFTK